jgi:prepilin-type N-terminal cleavage/methylation domain-containing protein
MKKGYTLIEMLVVVVIFAIVGLISSETIILTLRGTKKADAISKVRQNLDYAMESMQRQIRGAKSITSPCDGTTSSQISILDQKSNLTTYACINVNNQNLPSYIASSSASLTSNEVTISACSFICTPAGTNTTPEVTISITAQDKGGQNAPVTDTTQITLRTY